MNSDHSPTLLPLSSTIIEKFSIQAQSTQATHDSGINMQIKAANIQKLPPFWHKNPKIWFCQVESIFSLSRIKSDETKFRHLVANIDAATLDLVSDILESQGPNKYETLKSRILALFCESDERRLKRLLSGQVLGDQRPSKFLRTMQNLGKDQVSDNVIKSLFLEQLL